MLHLSQAYRTFFPEGFGAVVLQDISTPWSRAHSTASGEMLVHQSRFKYSKPRRVCCPFPSTLVEESFRSSWMSIFTPTPVILQLGMLRRLRSRKFSIVTVSHLPYIVESVQKPYELSFAQRQPRLEIRLAQVSSLLSHGDVELPRGSS